MPLREGSAGARSMPGVSECNQVYTPLREGPAIRSKASVSRESVSSSRVEQPCRDPPESCAPLREGAAGTPGTAPQVRTKGFESEVLPDVRVCWEIMKQAQGHRGPVRLEAGPAPKLASEALVSSSVRAADPKGASEERSAQRGAKHESSVSLAPGVKRGTLAAASAIIADPERAALAQSMFQRAALADTTGPVYDSVLKTLTALAKGAQVDLLPLTIEKVNLFGGAMKLAGYRSIANYLERWRGLHISQGHAWTPALALQFKGAKRAAVRDLGPPSRAAPLRLEEVGSHASLRQCRWEQAPRDLGAFVVVGVWWLLREVECAHLVVDAIEGVCGHGPVMVRLGATKTDIQGRGVSRGHRCLCTEHPTLSSRCPACVLRRQVSARLQEGASGSDWLFPAVVGDEVCVKRVTIEAMRAHYSPEAAGSVSGHSMRRTGAQMLAAAGVDPAMVEWFGRWGSSAVRAYIEDARARAPASSSLARIVTENVPGVSGIAMVEPASIQGATPVPVQALEDSAAELPAKTASELGARLNEQAPVGDSAWVAPPGQLGATQFVRYRARRLSKVHTAFAAAINGPRPGRTAVCGWSFGYLVGGQLDCNFSDSVEAHEYCRTCAAQGRRMGLPEGAYGSDIGRGKSSGSESSSSAESGSSASSES